MKSRSRLPLYLTTICCLSFSASYAFGEVDMFQELNKLKGNIYSMVTKMYSIQEKFGETVYGDEIISDTVFFNEHAKPERMRPFNTQHLANCRDKRFIYNDNGLIDSIVACSSVFKISYDEGRIVRIDEFGSSGLIGRETWKYTPHGYVRTIYNSGGTLKDVVTRNGNTLKKESDPGTVILNAAGNPVKYSYERSHDKFLETWEYNSHGDLISHISRHWYFYRNKWHEYDSSPREEKYTYEYDDNGNWVRKTSEVIDKSPGVSHSWLEVREFTCFDTREDLARHIKNLESRKTAMRLEAERIKKEKEEAAALRKQQEIEEARTRIKEREFKAFQNQIIELLKTSVFADKNKKGIKIEARDKYNVFTVKPRIDADGALEVSLPNGKSFGPFLFDSSKFEVIPEIYGKKERQPVAVPFVVSHTPQRDAALAQYNDYRIVLVFGEMNRRYVFFLK